MARKPLKPHAIVNGEPMAPLSLRPRGPLSRQKHIREEMSRIYRAHLDGRIDWDTCQALYAMLTALSKVIDAERAEFLADEERFRRTMSLIIRGRPDLGDGPTFSRKTMRAVIDDAERCIAILMEADKIDDDTEAERFVRKSFRAIARDVSNGND